MGTSTNKSSKLKHRFTRMLLGTSCNTTTNLPSACPRHLDPELDRHFRRRCKLDNPWPFPGDRSLPRGCAAPVVQVSISCGARGPIDAAKQPLLPLPREEEIKPTNRKQRSKIDLERSMSRSRRITEAARSLFDAYDFTSSSSDDHRLDLFSSDDDDEEVESRTLLSSKSFSSEYSSGLHCSTRKKGNGSRSMTRGSTGRRSRRQQAAKQPAGLRPVISEKEEIEARRNKNERGFAVVKRTTDPYRDFRRSMVEMIVEREMNSADELERLLDAYLALNSHRHHEAILDAFADICDAMFGK